MTIPFCTDKFFKTRLRIIPDDFKFVFIQKKVDKTLLISFIAVFNLVITNQVSIFEANVL